MHASDMLNDVIIIIFNLRPFLLLLLRLLLFLSFPPGGFYFFKKKVLPSTVNCKRCRVGGKDQRCSRNRVLPAAAGRCSIACTLVNAALVGLHISATFPYLLLIVANYILFYAV